MKIKDIIVQEVERYIQEKTKAAKMGVDVPDVIDQLMSYVRYDDAGETSPTHFMHFSDLNKLGINPKSSFRTPLGIYGYPITFNMVEQLKDGDIPFASERKYIHIFSLTEEGQNSLLKINGYGGQGSMDGSQLFKIIEKTMTDPSFNWLTQRKGRFYPPQRLKGWWEAVDPKPKNLVDLSQNSVFRKIAEEAKWETSFGIFWNFCRKMTWGPSNSKSSFMWAKLLRQLGWSGVFDPGHSVLHTNEPTQIVVFTKNFIEHRDTLDNKYTPNKAEIKAARRELKKLGALWTLKKPYVRFKDSTIKKIEEEIKKQIKIEGIETKDLDDPKIPIDIKNKIIRNSIGNISKDLYSEIFYYPVLRDNAYKTYKELSSIGSAKITYVNWKMDEADIQMGSIPKNIAMLFSTFIKFFEEAKKLEEANNDLQEKTKAAKMGVELEGTIGKLETHFLESLEDNKERFVHFSDLNKLGINPMSDYNTPLGIYGYRLTEGFINDVKKNYIPFASDREYMHVFTYKDDVRSTSILRIRAEHGINVMSWSTLYKIFDKLSENAEDIKKLIRYKPHKMFDMFQRDWKKMKSGHYDGLLVDPEEPLYEADGPNLSFTEYPVFTEYTMHDAFKVIESIRVANETSKFYSPFGVLWNFLRLVSRESDNPTLTWTKLLLFLGYNGVIDYGNSFIHENEPQQAVFFKKSVIDHIDTIINKETPQKIARRLKALQLKKHNLFWAMKEGVPIKFKFKMFEEADNLVKSKYRFDEPTPEERKESFSAAITKIMLDEVLMYMSYNDFERHNLFRGSWSFETAGTDSYNPIGINIEYKDDKGLKVFGTVRLSKFNKYFEKA